MRGRAKDRGEGQGERQGGGGESATNEAALSPVYTSQQPGRMETNARPVMTFADDGRAGILSDVYTRHHVNILGHERSPGRCCRGRSVRREVGGGREGESVTESLCGDGS